MHITGVICEYNPLHLGHKKQLTRIRDLKGTDCGIVCLMSGNFVQRGAPAIIEKALRAKAAVLSGADLVLELPATASLSSAEGFAAKGVKILSPFCHSLCFGAETAGREALLATAQALLSPDFSPALRQRLEQGLSFPAARQAALESLGLDGAVLTQPNNILAVEYCKAILSQDSPMEPVPILREGGYHDTVPNPANPSATALRQRMVSGGTWLDYVPLEAQSCFQGAALHTLSAGERAILARLRTMGDAEFESLPYGSEGLWRKFMHAVRQAAALEDVLTAVKSKRYTRTRLNRMVMCAFLGLTRQDMDAPVPYVRVLALNDRGRILLNRARETGCFPNLGQRMAHPYQALESRCTDLYGLFAQAAPEPAGKESRLRVQYLPEADTAY